MCKNQFHGPTACMEKKRPRPPLPLPYPPLKHDQRNSPSEGPVRSASEKRELREPPAYRLARLTVRRPAGGRSKEKQQMKGKKKASNKEVPLRPRLVADRASFFFMRLLFFESPFFFFACILSRTRGCPEPPLPFTPSRAAFLRGVGREKRVKNAFARVTGQRKHTGSACQVEPLTL